jgi:hypothetical protein
METSIKYIAMALATVGTAYFAGGVPACIVAFRFSVAIES